MTTIYVLELDQGKYYVGKSDNFLKRFNDHLKGKGSEWTQMYKPKKICKKFVIDSEIAGFEEEKITVYLMHKYGIDNVRGGCWSQIYLSDLDRKYIQKYIASATDKCYKCQQEGHYGRECDAEFKEKIKNQLLGRDTNKKNEKNEKNVIFTCELCNTNPFRDQWSLKRHLKSKVHIEKQYSIRLDTPVNPARNAKDRKRRTKNILEARFHCQFCGKNLSSNWSLKRHMCRVHGTHKNTDFNK